MREPFDPEAVGPIPTDEARFAHVVKHLLTASERWDLVVEGFPREALADGYAAGCGPMHLAPDRASFHDLPVGCRAWVLDMHDRHLAPAYRAAVQSAAVRGQWGWWRADERSQVALVGDNGVFVVVRDWGSPARPHVRTAYRVAPRGVRGAATRDDFLRAAVRKLIDKTSYGEKDPW